MTSTEKRYAKVIDYKKVFGSPVGKKVLMDMMSAHGVLRRTFVSGDPQLSAYNEGERGAVLRILSIISENEKSLLEIIEKEKGEGNGNSSY